MLQAVMTEPGQIEFRDVDKPTLQDDEVLIQIKRIGVCGSDIHVFHGLHLTVHSKNTCAPTRRLMQPRGAS